jgi:Mrp family chromosome partitioning ATPase
MDRLSEAISKARAARGDTPAQTLPAVTSKVPVRRWHPDDISARWKALKQVSLNRRQLDLSLLVAKDGGPNSAPFDMLRTKVLHQMRTNGWRRIGITSPLMGCGKSTVALNLAFSFARNPEMRTMLLDADLRRPSIATMLGVTPSASLFSVFAGRVQFEGCALAFGPNLCFATNGRPHRSPSELMQLNQVAEELDRIDAEYEPDVMLFDLAPILQTDDALTVLQRLDAVIIVAAAEVTSIKELDQCEADVAANTNVLGVVLNKARSVGQGYGYGYAPG